MAYILSWYIPDRVIHLTLRGNLTVTELKELNRQLKDYLDSGSKPIDLMIDASQVGTFPTIVTDISGALTTLSHPHLRWSLVTCTNKVLRLVLAVVFQRVRQHVFFFKTMEENIAHLRQQDHTLSSVKP